MFFSVSNDVIEWSLDFGPESVTLTVKDLVQDITKKTQKNYLAAWRWLLSQRQDFLSNHLARVPITAKQEGTKEMRYELLFSVCAQDMDTSGYQVFDLQEFEFYCKNDQLDVDAVFRPGLETPFSPTVFDDLEMEVSSENPILLHKEGDTKNSPLTTKVVERPTRARHCSELLPMEQE